MLFVTNSKFCSFYQNDTDRSFYLDFEHKSITLTFCQLLELRQKIYSLEIASLFYEESCPHDFKILTLCNQQHLLILSIEEVLDLKRLLQNAFISMGLSRPVQMVAI